MKVFKFGGASVKDANAVKNVATIIKDYGGTPLVVIVSAMGKTTNALEEIVSQLYKKENAEEKLVKLKEFHNKILIDLTLNESTIYTEVNELIDGIVSIPVVDSYDQYYDSIVSLGEVLSTKIIAAYLLREGIDTAWIDARELVYTNDVFRDAKVDWENTFLNINKSVDKYSSKVFLSQGFIGGNSKGNTTTLGREGSDFSAGIFAYCLDAESVTIWKDVPGMLNADPKYFEKTTKLDKISYREALELSYYGASVIHPKTIKPLQNKDINLYVKSFVNPDSEGTVIHKSAEHDTIIASFIFKVDQVLLSITPKDFSFIMEEHLSDIFAELARLNLKINLMQNSALNFSICVNGDKSKLEELLNRLSKDYQVKYNEGLELLTVRHYNQDVIDELLVGKTVLVEQKSRETARYVLS